ncbi:hypothetical protein QBC34DRAFT_152629 [Podospora aff. communis PSN243]|uniref:Uncharacterized protein n=1 Tax=Podospora aff. communis PSN243 TaxID=3040156 RepID=A0AAV9GF35_9PEZI|nr:hypothetical protein QBC34DRAFT_152629 [Podospora aff. communis PSN243]
MLKWGFGFISVSATQPAVNCHGLPCSHLAARWKSHVAQSGMRRVDQWFNRALRPGFSDAHDAVSGRAVAKAACQLRGRQIPRRFHRGGGNKFARSTGSSFKLTLSGQAEDKASDSTVPILPTYQHLQHLFPRRETDVTGSGSLWLGRLGHPTWEVTRMEERMSRELDLFDTESELALLPTAPKRDGQTPCSIKQPNLWNTNVTNVQNNKKGAVVHMEMQHCLGSLLYTR